MIKPCPICKKISFSVEKRRLNTAYEKKEQNHLISCKLCFIETIEYYSDLWDSYYNSVR